MSNEYMICDTLAEAVEVVETCFKAHFDIGDLVDAEAQLCYYKTEGEDAIGIIALVNDVPWDKLPVIYVPMANLSKTDKKSLVGWMMFSTPNEETGEMEVLREAGSDEDFE